MEGLLWLECGGSRCQGLYADMKKIPQKFDVDTGYNALTDSREHLKTLLMACKKLLGECTPQHVFLGVAGLTTDNAPEVFKVLSQVWSGSLIQVFNDLEALARAFGKPCVAGILGTGAAACLWDGQSVLQVGPSLGWIVGDEGSGAWLGKQLVKERFYDLMPASLVSSWDEFIGTNNRSIILKKIYSSDGRAWLAGLTRWLSRPEVRHTDWARQLLRRGFEAYIRHQVMPLISSRLLPEWVLAGGVAWHFHDEFLEVAQDQGLFPSTIAPSATGLLLNLSAEEIYSRLCLGTH